MATFSEYEELCARLRTAHTSASAEQLSKFLRLVRELRIRDSEATAKYGGQLLSSYRSTLSEEECKSGQAGHNLSQQHCL
ncbi:ER membrane protein complex subunit 2 [Haematococcus lacustris]|uniref:ER membrane protein complex subunit 2 n=1 Tax=Haematococcus lacustris TaxID=44745 RepID=A0A6A0A5Q9_HAELA|nr:ER membrane protein complex subunit 2 [Haematococcus lacustris]